MPLDFLPGFLCIEGRSLEWAGVLLTLRPVAEHRGWKRIRSMEYLG